MLLMTIATINDYDFVGRHGNHFRITRSHDVGEDASSFDYANSRVDCFRTHEGDQHYNSGQSVFLPTNLSSLNDKHFGILSCHQGTLINWYFMSSKLLSISSAKLIVVV